MSDDYYVNLTCVVPDETMIVRVLEVFGRAASGLAMEGLTVNMNVSQLHEEEEGAEA